MLLPILLTILGSLGSGAPASPAAGTAGKYAPEHTTALAAVSGVARGVRSLDYMRGL